MNEKVYHEFYISVLSYEKLPETAICVEYHKCKIYIEM